MKEKLNYKYPLDIQLFAEEDPTQPGASDPTPPAPNQPAQATVNVDYDKIEEIINKRLSATEEKTFKGILKDEGLSEEEIKQAVADFKNRKQKKAIESQNEIDRIIEENKAFKKEKELQKVTKEAKTIATELKVKSERFDKLMKISDQSKFVKEDGTIDKEAIKAEFEEQLKDLPEFVETGKKTIVVKSVKGVDVPETLTDEEEYRRRKYGKNKYFKG